MTQKFDILEKSQKETTELGKKLRDEHTNKLNELKSEKERFTLCKNKDSESIKLDKQRVTEKEQELTL